MADEQMQTLAAASSLDYAALCAATGELQLEEGSDPQTAAALLRQALSQREQAGASTAEAADEEEDDWEKGARRCSAAGVRRWRRGALSTCR